MSEHSEVRQRTVVLMRHGHAAGMSALGDRKRPLTDHGRQEVAEVAAVLAARGFKPSVVLVSSALRTRETWQQAASVGLGGGQVEVLDELYNAPAGVIVECLRALPADADQVLVVAHFPGVPEAIEVIAEGRGDDDAWQQLRWGFPTAAAATLRVPGEWDAVDNAELVDFDAPA